MEKQIFISHSSKDHEAAQQICNVIESNGLKCWIAPRDVRSGEQWDVEILNGIEDTPVFILLLSKNSNISEHVKRELTHAANSKSAIFPVRIEENIKPSKGLQFYLDILHWTDVWQKPIESKMVELISTIKEYLRINVNPEPTPSEELTTELNPDAQSSITINWKETHENFPVRIQCAVWIEDGKILAAGVGKELLIIDFKTFQVVKKFYGQTALINALYYDKKNKVLYSAAGDKIIIWNIDKGIINSVIKFSIEYFRKIFSFDNSCKYILEHCHNNSNPIIQIKDINTGEIISSKLSSEFDANQSCGIFYPDGTKFVLGFYDGSIRYFNTKDFSIIKSGLMFESNMVVSMKFNKSGRFLLSYSSNSDHLKIWDYSKQIVISTLENNHGSFMYYMFMNNENALVNFSSDLKVSIWDVSY
jgi:hypothetical protein